jgi:hypothetical protein
MRIEAVDAVDALGMYVRGSSHDPALWGRLLGPDPIRDLAAADPVEVDGLLMAAAKVEGAPKGEARELVRAVRAARKSGRSRPGEVVGMDGRPVEGDDAGAASITDVLREAGMDDAPAGLDVPAGYVVQGRAGRVYRIVPGRGDAPPSMLPVSPVLIAVVGRVRSAAGREWLVLTWRRAGRWARVVAPREIVVDRAVLTRLVGEGMPADAGSMREVQVWIARQEATNMRALPEAVGAETMGWVDPRDPSAGFVVGERVIGAVGGEAEVVGLRAEIAALTGAYRPGGTWEGWLAGVWAPVSRHPIASGMMYLSMAGPLLALVPEASPVVGDLGGPSSGGKSITLEACQSAWGHPQDGLGRWDGTAKGTELRGRQHGGIPLIMDDTKEALETEDGRAKVVQTVFCYTSTGTRSRTGQDGRLETLGSIRGILMTAGETPVADVSSGSQGAIARLVTVFSPPWGERSAAARAVADGVRRAAQLHHGHAGPRLAAWLARRTPEEIGRMRERYLSLVEQYQAGVGDSGPAQRMAAHLALVHLAGICCSAAWGVPLVEAAMAALQREQRGQVQAADMVARGYAVIEGYLAARDSQVVGQARDEQIRGEIVGRWTMDDMHPMITESAAKRALREAGMDVDNVIRQLVEAKKVEQTRRRLGAGMRASVLVLLDTRRESGFAR